MDTEMYDPGPRKGEIVIGPIIGPIIYLMRFLHCIQHCAQRSIRDEKVIPDDVINNIPNNITFPRKGEIVKGK